MRIAESHQITFKLVEEMLFLVRMEEIRFHGRGGQGAVTAANILATAAFKEGKHVQAFPIFGTERRGAPVAAFVRVDDKPIRVRYQVYNPDIVVVLDSSLLDAVDVTAGLKEGGTVLINTGRKPSDFDLGGFKVVTVDATSIAVDHKLGSASAPIVNTAILGAYAKVAETTKVAQVGLKTIVESIGEGAPAKAKENQDAAEQAYEKVVM